VKKLFAVLFCFALVCGLSAGITGCQNKPAAPKADSAKDKGKEADKAADKGKETDKAVDKAKEGDKGKEADKGKS
jgi:hypothetical protein